MTMERTTTSGVRVAVAGAIVLGLLLGSRGANGLNLAHRLKPMVTAARADVAAAMPKSRAIAVSARPHPATQAAELFRPRQPRWFQILLGLWM